MTAAQTPLPRALSAELRLARPGLDIRAQFRVLPGQVCALVGRSGSGKSSVLKAAAGMAPTLGGRVALGNDVLYDSVQGVNRPPHQRRLGWLDANGHLFPHLNVRSNLRYSQPWWPNRQDNTQFDDLVQWLDLGSLLKLRPEGLTPAQRFRVALGRLLLAQPQALLLDDPLGAVPSTEQDKLVEVLAGIPQRCKVPMLLVSPRMSEVIRMADDVVILHEGRLAGAGPAAQILSDVSLSTFLEGVHAGSVLEGEIKRHDIQWLLSEVDVAGQRITVPAQLHPVGSRVRLKVRARDLTLHRHVPTDTTASNVLRGRISQIMLAGEHGTYGAVGVQLDQAWQDDGEPPPAHGANLWAMLTRKSIQQMDWQPGQPCLVSFKAMATQVSAWH